ncbi:repa, partial [Clostridioides difficile]
HFTKGDVNDAQKALKADDKLPSTMASREWTEKQTMGPSPPNKRNGRKQASHAKYMNNQRACKVEMGECTNGGRPEKSKSVEEWRKTHPDGRKADCQRVTGLDPKTIRKCWK